MKVLEAVREKLGAVGEWQLRGGAEWLDPAPASVRAVAAAMNEAGARLITITAYQREKAAGFRLEYHWDLQGTLLGFAFEIADAAMPSIYDLCPAVDWIEREVHEGFGIRFEGHPYLPLLLRPDAEAGVNLREEAVR